jgi:ArsR family transcriptional regulator
MSHCQKQLRALADENRWEIIRLLLSHEYCVGALANNLGISGAAVSQHLRVLREAGLVKGEKRGYWTHYQVERKALIALGEVLIKLGREKAAQPQLCPRGTSPAGKSCTEACPPPEKEEN